LEKLNPEVVIIYFGLKVDFFCEKAESYVNSLFVLFLFFYFASCDIFSSENAFVEAPVYLFISPVFDNKDYRKDLDDI
jgi:hypothetical protein